MFEALHDGLVRGDRLEHQEVADQGCAVGWRERIDRPRCEDRLPSGPVPASALDVTQRPANGSNQPRARNGNGRQRAGPHRRREERGRRSCRLRRRNWQVSTH